MKFTNQIAAIFSALGIALLGSACSPKAETPNQAPVQGTQVSGKGLTFSETQILNTLSVANMKACVAAHKKGLAREVVSPDGQKVQISTVNGVDCSRTEENGYEGKPSMPIWNWSVSSPHKTGMKMGDIVDVSVSLRDQPIELGGFKVGGDSYYGYYLGGDNKKVSADTKIIVGLYKQGNEVDTIWADAQNGKIVKYQTGMIGVRERYVTPPQKEFITALSENAQQMKDYIGKPALKLDTPSVNKITFARPFNNTLGM